MITPTLIRLRERLLEIEDRLAAARFARSASPAVIATLYADAAALRAEIASVKRSRLERDR